MSFSFHIFFVILITYLGLSLRRYFFTSTSLMSALSLAAFISVVPSFWILIFLFTRSSQRQLIHNNHLIIFLVSLSAIIFILCFSILFFNMRKTLEAKKGLEKFAVFHQLIFIENTKTSDNSNLHHIPSSVLKELPFAVAVPTPQGVFILSFSNYLQGSPMRAIGIMVNSKWNESGYLYQNFLNKIYGTEEIVINNTKLFYRSIPMMKVGMSAGWKDLVAYILEQNPDFFLKYFMLSIPGVRFIVAPKIDYSDIEGWNNLSNDIKLLLKGPL